MKISDIMTKTVQIVSPETPLHDVAKAMRQHDCGSILVEKDNRLVGVITDRDIALRCVAESHDPAGTNAGQVMTKQVLYCNDTDELDDVALDMTKNKVRRLPVLNKEKRLVGIVSLGDMAANSTDEHHRICGKALGHICADPNHGPQEEERMAAHA